MKIFKVASPKKSLNYICFCLDEILKLNFVQNNTTIKKILKSKTKQYKIVLRKV